MLLNISPPWLVWGPLLAIIFSLAPVASVLLIRWTKEGKPYLGTYTAFWAGEGICFAVLEAITSIVMDGKVPHAFYTEFWFYPVYVAIYIVTWKTTDLFENDAEKRGRPESIRKKSQSIGTQQVVSTNCGHHVVLFGTRHDRYGTSLGCNRFHCDFNLLVRGPDDPLGWQEANASDRGSMDDVSSSRHVGTCECRRPSAVHLAFVSTGALRFYRGAPHFFSGTLPPALRASDKPIATACFLLVTFLPLFPLLSFPSFISCIAFPTLS